MRALDFNRLPPDTRQRIVACFEGKAPPFAILSQQTSPGAATFGWVCLFLLGLAGAISFAAAGFGTTYTFHQKFPFILGYAVAFFFIIFSILRIVKVRVKKGALPFKPGTYVFPLDIVVADDGIINVHSLSELVEMQPTHHYTNGVYQQTTFRFSFQGGRSFSLSVAPKAKAEQTLAYFREVRMKAVEAAEKRDFDTLMQMDLFASARMNDTWDKFDPSAGIQATPIPAWLKRASLVALAPALLLAIPAYFLRNFVSDESAYRSLQAYGSSSSCETYIREDGRHADDVKRLQLPRAFLREMKAKKSALAIRYFFKKYPSSEVQSEAQKELEAAIALDYATAKTKGSVSALREFLRDNPGSSQEKEARAEIHRLFQNALATFRVKASRADLNLVPFVDQLLVQLEKYDSPPVAVKFVRVPTDSLTRADQVIESELTPAERVTGFAKATPLR